MWKIDDALLHSLNDETSVNNKSKEKTIKIEGSEFLHQKKDDKYVPPFMVSSVEQSHRSAIVNLETVSTDAQVSSSYRFSLV